MKAKLIIAVSILLLGTSISINAKELLVEFKIGKPTQKEFVIAAKRAFFKHHYVITQPAADKVSGTYKKRVTMEMILMDNAVIIRNTDEGGKTKPEVIKRYLKTLRRDLTYELAEYLL